MINQLNDSIGIVDKDGIMENRFSDWTKDVTRLQISSANLETVLNPTGNPEGFIEALVTALYMNEGAATPVLYIKQKSEIGGDKKKGWVPV